MKKLSYIFLATLLLSACNPFRNCSEAGCAPEIFPDFTDIPLPVNIAPLNFQMDGARAIGIRVQGKQEYEFSSTGKVLRFSEDKWREMLEAEQGERLRVTVYARMDGKNLSFKPFFWEIRSEKIDKYLSYRLIEPSYEVWNVISVEERDVESFNTRLLADNKMTENSCFNCHTSNRAAVPSSFLHLRGPKGGTLVSRDGKFRKLNTATDSTSGAAVYGEISQDGRYGIFTTADIRPILHSDRLSRFEVFDATSDLIVLDFDKGTVSDSPAVKGPEFQETFPCWSPDGRSIYFCRAESHPQPQETKQMHYNLCRISFDPESGRLGDDISTVYDAAANGQSVSFPKCSPDGKRILFCISDYGTFPIWHPETDLRMLDIESGQIDSLQACNGKYSDSYHCWSGNGRWICWASKRADRVYGRPYFAFVAPDGSVSKAFVLPQKNPESYISTLKSYNIPELYDNPEIYDAAAVRDAYCDMSVEQMKYEKK